jgi:SRSO17 transposase
VRGLDDTGCPPKGRPSAGVARLDRDLSRPQAWTDDRERGQQAGMPENRGVATTPEVARQRRARTVAAGGPATWVTGDRG